MPGAEQRTFDLGALGVVRIVGTLGEGGRSIVYRAEWEGRLVAFKVYKRRAVERHARRHRLGIAEFEYSRNLAFYRAPGLARYVTQPLGHLDSPRVSAILQEALDGELYYFHFRERRGKIAPELFGHVQRMVELAHAAGLYDLDLHAMNVMVVREGDETIPKLFDFNLRPTHEFPRNPLDALLLRTGIKSPRSRDLRKLRRFHDFRRVEKKLVRYYPNRTRPEA
ncbi:MAG: hypothetical protein ACE5HQ_05015 [Gemmatimonadota bacterium]